MNGGWFFILAIFALLLFVSGCASKPVIETQIIEKPVPIFCTVATPAECKDAYAVDRVSPQDDPVTINRAFRQEIEERWQCEIKLKAALKGCNSSNTGDDSRYLGRGLPQLGKTHD